MINFAAGAVVGGLLVGLTACGPSDKERLEAFRQKCQPAFNAAQCAVLTELYATSIRANSAADVGVAIGTANAVQNAIKR